MKRAPTPRPAWIEICAIDHGSENVIDFPMIQDRAALMWVINLGCIDLNQWYATLRRRRSARLRALRSRSRRRRRRSSACSRPALVVHEALDTLKMPSVVKTTGSKGLHVYVPIVRGPEQKQVWTFAKALAHELAVAQSGADHGRVPRREAAEGTRARRLQPEPLGQHAGVDLLGAAAAGGDGVDAGDLEGSRAAASASRTSRSMNVPARVAKVGDLWKPLLRRAAASICRNSYNSAWNGLKTVRYQRSRYTSPVRRVTRREFIGTAAGAAAIAGSGCIASAAPARRPNVAVHPRRRSGLRRFELLRPPDYKTPVLDAFAKEGIMFTSAYAAAPVCTPTRCAYITGRYPQRLAVGLEEPLRRASPPDVGLPPEHPTVASLLKQNGYDTSLVGKWHLGWKPEFGPNRHGFDEFFGILSGAADYFTHRGDGPGAGSRTAAPDLWENLTPIERPGYLTDLLTDKAIEVIARPHAQPVFPEPAVQRAACAVGRSGRRHDRPHRARTRADGRRRIAAHLRGDDAEPGRGHRPGVEGAPSREARTRDAGDFHQRQRRRTLLVQLAVFVPEDVPVRRRHARAGDRPLAGRDPGRASRPRRRRSPWTGRRRFSPSPARRPIAALSARRRESAAGLHRRSRRTIATLFWRTPSVRAARDGRWKYLKDQDGEYLFDLSVDPGEKDDRRRVEAARSSVSSSSTSTGTRGCCRCRRPRR